MKNIKLILLLFLFVVLTSSYLIVNIKTVPNGNSTTKLDSYYGVNLVAPIKELRTTTLTNLKENNVNAVSLIPYAFVDLENNNIIYDSDRQWWGETTAGIIACAKQAHALNLRVMLKPHLWIKHNVFTGNLDFQTDEEWEKWETEYEKYILNYAKLAESEKIELFCFATELKNPIAKRPQYWSQLIAKIRAVYKGKLTYAANWDEYETVPFWDQLDFIGIDAYFPLSNTKTPTVNELKTSWETPIKKLKELHKKHHKKIIFTEFGYRNSDYATQEPWTETNTVQNNQAQANAYQALFEVVKDAYWYQGGFAWKWYADEYYKQRKKIDYTPQDKPALVIIREFYR